MLRRAVVVMAWLIGVGAGQTALADSLQDILVAGNSQIAFIDANNNGMHDPGDCFLSAKVRTNGMDLMVKGTQAAGPNLLLVCTGQCNGSGFISSGFGEAMIDNCDYSGTPNVPLVADFCETVSSCESDGTPTTAIGGSAGGGLPLRPIAGEVFQTFSGFDRVGGGQVCTAGGPAAIVEGDDGVKVLRNLFRFPNATNPTHLCADNVPVELATGGFVFRTACFPIAPNGTSPVALSDSPEAPFAIIDFSTLQACGANQGAPTASEWGLIFLMLTLLAGGTGALSRRRHFAGALLLA